MSFGDNDGLDVPTVPEEDEILSVVDTDASKWAAVHDALDPTPRIAPSSSAGTIFTVAWVLGITLGLVWVMRNGRTVFDQWQENVQRRTNRRRHGIPDDDDRPFNVAYAAAALERRHREEAEKKLANARRGFSRRGSDWARQGAAMGSRRRSSQSEGSDPLSYERGNAQPMFLQGASTHSLRNTTAPFIPGESSPHRTQFRPQPPIDSRKVEAYDWADRHDANSDMGSHQGSRLKAPPVRPPSVDASRRRRLDVDARGSTSAERRKHYQVADSDDEDRTTKKFRVDGDELIDGDNDAAWDSHMPSGSRRGSLQVPKRGSKRHANPEDDDDWEMSQDKRARKGSAAHIAAEHGEDIIDVDMIPDISEAEAEPARGTKREREDAESVANSAAYDTDELAHSRPARKRRVDNRRRLEFKEPLPRGQKRDRSSEQSTTSDDEESDARPTRSKRGRPHEGPQEEDSDIVPADVSESESDLAVDPACGSRRRGETWEVNGQAFKVGLDGRRLRHALIRKSRSKFPMPKDSAHNDARTNMDVVVEKWLNDDEYKIAKENYELAWQDSSPTSTPDKATAPTKIEASLSSGKRLLWTGPPPSPTKGRASMGGRFTANVQNPFDLAPTNAGRRVASVQLLNSSPGESPKLRSAKSFSKWEKQELEASSLKKMRARIEKQKTEAAVAAAAAAPPPAPAPTPLMPSTNSPAQPSPSIQFNVDTKRSVDSAPSMPSSTPSVNPFAKPPSSTPSAPTPSFSFAKSESTPSSTALTHTQRPAPSSTANPAPAAPSVSKPSFSFASTPPPGSTPAEANKSSAQKPSFSFGPSNTSSSSTPVASGAAKPSFSFGPTSSEPSKSPFSFGPTAGSTPSSDPTKSVTSNFFAKPASQPTSAPIATATVTSASSSPFTFNTTSQPAQPTASKTPSFQFNSSNASGQSNPSSSSGSGSGSLLNRLGPASTASQAPAMQNSWSAPLGMPASSASPFAPTATTNQSSSIANAFGQNQSQSKPPSNPPSSFGQPQLQNASQPSSSSNPFGPQSQPGASKSITFGPSTTPQSEAPKNFFGPPSSVPAVSAFSIAKPPGQADTGPKPATPSFSFANQVAQSSSSSTQPKPSFSFNFGNSSSPGNTNAGTSNTPSPNPFNPSGTQANPSGFGFNSGSSSTATPSNPSPFGFGFKPAEGEKK